MERPIPNAEDNTPDSSGAGRVMREMRVTIRRIACDGNNELRLDSGVVLHPNQQAWTPGHVSPMLFEGLFHVPVLTLNLRLLEPLAVPARVKIIGDADNGMRFVRESTFPAGRSAQTVRQVESDRAAGGVFDYIGSIRWRIESNDAHAGFDDQSETRHHMYFVPGWHESFPPLHTVLHVVCRALRGLPMGHEDAIERIWSVFEGLSVPCPDGVEPIVCAPEGHGRESRTVDELLKRKSGSGGAWVDFFQACLRMAGRRTGNEPEDAGDDPWPWTVDGYELKLRLLEAKCRHAIREAGPPMQN